MNYSIYSADRTTHLKIVVVALAASIGIASFANRGPLQGRRSILPDGACGQSRQAELKVCRRVARPVGRIVRLDLCQRLSRDALRGSRLLSRDRSPSRSSRSPNALAAPA